MPAKGTPSITVTREMIRGKRKFVATFRVNKGRERRYFASRKAANAKKKEWQDEINKAGAAWTTLKAHEKADNHFCPP